jgi:hypothetical protein
METILPKRNQGSMLFGIVWCAVFSLVEVGLAQEWTQTLAQSNAWHCLAVSADSTRLAAGIYQTLGKPTGGPIYFSSDYGNTWIQSTAPTNKWSSIASSADGSKLFAVADDGNQGSCRVFLSTNFGIAWSTNVIGNGGSHVVYPPQIACSADGNTLVSSYYGVIWVSTNAGITWTSNSPPIQNYETPAWFSVACSADGSNLITVKLPEHLGYGYPYAPNIFISTNTGSSWLQISNLSFLGYLASSADGNTLVIAMGSGTAPFVLTSTNKGLNWTTNSLPLYCAGIAISADGTRMLAAGLGGWIRSSSNSGGSWITNTPFDTSMQWAGGAISADGARWFLTSQPTSSTNSGRIYTLQTTPSETLNLKKTDNGLLLSWLIPSTNCLLQQSSDLLSWLTISNTAVLDLSTLKNEVSLPTPDSHGFYRLVIP